MSLFAQQFAAVLNPTRPRLPSGIARVHRIEDDPDPVEVPAAEREGHKVCKCCGKEKPLAEFYFRASRGKHMNECKRCFIGRRKDKNPPRGNASTRKGKATQAAILDCLQDAAGPMTTREVSAKTGIDWEVCRKHMKRLVTAKALTRSGNHGSHQYRISEAKEAA